MERILIPVILCLAACQQMKSPAATDSLKTTLPDTIAEAPAAPQTAVAALADTIAIMPGDFNGDGKPDTAVAVLFEKRVEEDSQDKYAVRFTASLPGITPAGGPMRLVNEGDLDKDGADELSFFTEPLHGCVYSMTTWTFKKERWSVLAGPWLAPTACGPVSDEDLQKRIVLENDTVFYFSEDVEDEHFTLLKKPLPLKQSPSAE